MLVFIIDPMKSDGYIRVLGLRRVPSWVTELLTRINPLRWPDYAPHESGLCSPPVCRNCA